MTEGRPLRSTRRVANALGHEPDWQRPAWYSIRNAAPKGGPTQVAIYDEIGFYGVTAGAFMADLDGITGDLEMHINSPGGDIYDGLTIYNRLKQRAGTIHVVVDGLAASAASFIAMAASPGKLEMAPRSELMVHNGFTMCIGDASDLRKAADLVERKTADIADIYAERSGKPRDYWLGRMADETWLSAEQSVAEGLADSITGQGGPSNSWDLSVYNKIAADGTWAHGGPDGKAPGAGGGGSGEVAPVLNADSDHAPMTGTHTHPVGDGDPAEHTHDDDNSHDPDGDGDDDTTAEGDTDHDYVEPDGTPGPKASANVPAWLMPDVDESPWDAAKAMADAAASDNPERWFRAICAGRRPGPADSAEAWALPYRYSPDSPPNASGVLAALGQAEAVKGLTNRDEAREQLEKIARWVDPDYTPAAFVDATALASVLTPRRDVDESAWDPAAALVFAAASPDPEAYFRGICAGRRPGNPATADAWALPYRYTPNGPANASGVRTALAELPAAKDLANADEARERLDTALRAITPDPVPDEEIDTALLAAAFAHGLKGAGK